MKTNWGRFLFFTVLISSSVGCATPRAAQRFEGGFHEEQLTEDTFWIGFEGNLPVDAQTLEDSLLRHAAELTIRSDFTYFSIVNRGRQVGVGLSLSPQALGPSRTSGQSMTIRCYIDHPGGGDVIDAQQWLHAHEPSSSPPPPSL